MKPDQVIVLGLTFLSGVLLGAFVYVTSFAPVYAPEAVEERSAIAITGEMYGGCERNNACPVFRLTESRAYEYFDASGERLSGALSQETFRRISAELTEASLSELARPTVNAASCSSYADGVEYRYEVRLGSMRYTLDTCTTALSEDSLLQQAFLVAWEEMLYPERQYPILLEKGVGAWFIDRFQNTATEDSPDPVPVTERVITPPPVPAADERYDEPVFACTMEAKLCPDGTYVGRTGPRCEFAACPGM